MSFSTLGLSDPLLKALSDSSYLTPTPIQEQAIPAVLAGRDVMAAAQTGTGKTAGFTLPLLQRLDTSVRVSPNRVRALVLTPTRELAAQVEQSVKTYGKYLNLRSAVVFGGVKINPQMMSLRKGVDILVATPGRLLDLHEQNAVKFDQLEVLVLDEADRMLDMGFIHQIRKIIALLPSRRQNLMFSATFSDDIRTLAKTIVYKPVEISVSPPNATANTVEQWVYPVDKTRKSTLLQQLMRDRNWYQVLVFTKTKHGADRLARDLNKAQVSALAIHGNKSQGARTKALADFKSGAIRALVATDIAARGLDIDQLPQVVNFELPNVPEDYVHRIGRTGRAGAEGVAISLVCADEFAYLVGIENLINKIIPRKLIHGYQPLAALPESRLGMRVAKPKKPNAQSPQRAEKSPQRADKSPQRPEKSRQRAENRPQRTEQKKQQQSNNQNPQSDSKRPQERRNRPKSRDASPQGQQSPKEGAQKRGKPKRKDSGQAAGPAGRESTRSEASKRPGGSPSW